MSLVFEEFDSEHIQTFSTSKAIEGSSCQIPEEKLNLTFPSHRRYLCMCSERKMSDNFVDHHGMSVG